VRSDVLLSLTLRRYYPCMTTRALSLIAACALALACRPGTPVIDPGDTPAVRDGTIAGRVLTDGDAAVVSRIVRAIAADGTRHEATTNSAGTYSMKVPPGKYRLEVELRAGERLIKGPTETEVNASDLDPDRSFVIGPK
jgi:hypothetical protein